MPARYRPPPPLTPNEAALLERWPDLVTLPRSDWERAAAHLEDARNAAENGTACPWCAPVGWLR